jgi:Kef-type K+ transport system membrane component KefB
VDEATKLLISIGGLLLLGLVADSVGRGTRIPRVTLLMLFGVAIGGSGFDLLPDAREEWFPVLADVALVMIGFLLGGQFTREELREHGRTVLLIAIAESLGAAAVVTLGLLAVGVETELALILGGIAAATAPAATAAVVQSSGGKGDFPKTLLGVVALDDVFGLVFFSLLATAAAVVAGNGGQGELLIDAGQELGGGVLLGVALGLPMAYLSGRIREGEPTREEALGIVLLLAGLANWLDVSGLLAAVVLGVVVANLAKHHEFAFREIEDIEWPFLVLFFVLSGASLETSELGGAGLLAVGYIALRTVGKLGGAYLGTSVAGTSEGTRRWLGLALLPQAGVALGLALEAADRFPGFAAEVLPSVVLATVVFEVGGTLLTQVALRRAGAESGEVAAVKAED